MIAMSLEQQIKDKALALGFDGVGITDAAPVGAEHVAHFEAWLRCGYAGRMDYLHRNLDKRMDPAKLLDGAKSVIVVALGYRPRESIADNRRVAMPPTGKVAQYAQYEDYHEFVRSLLHELVDFVQAQTDDQQRFRICIDSAPVAEKALAVRAGLGFLGKNHLLIHPQLGPQILLGEIATTVSLCPDEPGRDAKSCVSPCAGCGRCLEACPTGALRPDGFLDARRCISYLTQYGMPEESADRTGSWLFGCDECLLACPFQQTAPPCANRRFQRYDVRAELNLREVLEWTAEEFEARFRDSPVRRLGLERFKHNARRCLKGQV
jgi:epoxyqueuosine reductase